MHNRSDSKTCSAACRAKLHRLRAKHGKLEMSSDEQLETYLSLPEHLKTRANKLQLFHGNEVLRTAMELAGHFRS